MKMASWATPHSWTQQLSAAWFPQSTSRHIQAVQDVEAEGSAPKRNRDALEIMAKNHSQSITTCHPSAGGASPSHWEDGQMDIFGSSVHCHRHHPPRSCLRPGWGEDVEQTLKKDSISLGKT
jgi:hypothetical protein